jgi:hypothetical protein
MGHLSVIALVTTVERIICLMVRRSVAAIVYPVLLAARSWWCKLPRRKPPRIGERSPRIASDYTQTSTRRSCLHEVHRGNFQRGYRTPGNYADYYANDDLGEFFQFSKPPRKFQKITAPLGEEVFLNPERLQGAPDND